MIKFNKKPILMIAISSTLATQLFSFDFESALKNTIDTVNQATQTSNSGANINLKDSTITRGLKEALKVGAKYGVETLGKKNGYLNNKDAKIKLPKNLEKLDGVIRKAGGDKIINDLILSMNNAATQAAPKTIEIFIDAIEKISIKDSKAILAGDNDAITKYFKKNTTQSLKKLIKPIIQKSMQDNNVAKYYDTFNSFYKENIKDITQNNSLMQAANSYGLGDFISQASDKNLDEHITDGAIRGLFKIIAKKEKDIRTKASAQTTSILKKVFGR